MSFHPFRSRARLVFAHRGGAKLAPENTLPAFAHGLALGCDGLECDVHLSRDGVPVVIHDRTLERTTDAAGPVSERTADELWQVDAGCRFVAPDGSMPFKGRGIGVPRLETVLRAHPEAQVIIEMKQREPALARAVLDVIRATGALGRVCVGSFHRESLAAIRAAEPALVTSASEPEARWTLYRSWMRWPFRATRVYSAFQVPERTGRLRVVTPAFVRQAHLAGARVDVWVVDSAEDTRRLFTWGVNGVITDRPDLVVPECRRWRAAARAGERATSHDDDHRNPYDAASHTE